MSRVALLVPFALAAFLSTPISILHAAPLTVPEVQRSVGVENVNFFFHRRHHRHHRYYGRRYYRGY